MHTGIKFLCKLFKCPLPPRSDKGWTPGKFAIEMLPHQPKLAGGLRVFVLSAPAEFWSWGDVHVFTTLQQGFKWDGSSAPVGRQRLLFASAVHDRDYAQCANVARSNPSRARQLRKDADVRLCLSGAFYDNQPVWLCLLSYICVRIFGGAHIKNE